MDGELKFLYDILVLGWYNKCSLHVICAEVKVGKIDQMKTPLDLFIQPPTLYKYTIKYSTSVYVKTLLNFCFFLKLGGFQQTFRYFYCHFYFLR